MHCERLTIHSSAWRSRCSADRVTGAADHYLHLHLHSATLITSTGRRALRGSSQQRCSVVDGAVVKLCEADNRQFEI